MEEVLAELESWRVRTLVLLGEITGTPSELIESDLSVAAVLELGSASASTSASSSSPSSHAGELQAQQSQENVQGDSAASDRESVDNERAQALSEALAPPARVLRVLSECATTGLTCVQWPALRLLLACQIRAAAEDIAGTENFEAHVRALIETDSHDSGRLAMMAPELIPSLVNVTLHLSTEGRATRIDGSDALLGADRVQPSPPPDSLQTYASVSEDENPTLIGVLDELDGFTDAPFTLQRLCELVLGYRSMFLPSARRRDSTADPSTLDQQVGVGLPLTRRSLHGSPLDKFVFAVDRTLRVRSTLPALTPAEYNSCVQQLFEARTIVETETAEILARTEARLFSRPPRESMCTVEFGPPLRRGGPVPPQNDGANHQVNSSDHPPPSDGHVVVDTEEPGRSPFSTEFDAFSPSTAIADVLATPLPGEYLDSGENEFALAQLHESMDAHDNGQDPLPFH